MTPEQLQAAYDEGWNRSVLRNMRHPRAADHHTAGLAEVARQQAEHDAQLANEHTSADDDDYGRGWRRGALIIARTIRAQFANPSTTPKETR